MDVEMDGSVLTDPLKFKELLWPDVKFYDRQVEIISSVVENDETFVPAGNALGKDFISAFICLWFFCSRTPARVVTTSVDHSQLKSVLWGEIRRFIQTARFKLPIQENDLLLRQLGKDGELVPLGEMVGRTVAKGEGMLGRHIARTENGLPRTLIVFDEASGIDDAIYESSDTWAHRKLIIGNPYPTTNFFYKGVKGGDLPRTEGEGYFRKVIQIKAEDSPNVRLAQAEEKKKGEGNYSGYHLVPGVVDYDLYKKRRRLWDKIRQSIGLDAEFYEGAEVLLFPPDWLERSVKVAQQLSPHRAGKAIGCDPAEGGDSSSWSVVDEVGLLELFSCKTPDTSVIPNHTLRLMSKWGVPPEKVFFDRGGGGKQHADQMRKQGHRVNTVGFGEAATDPKKLRRMRTLKERTQEQEQKYTYKNRRAEMYGLLREMMDPTYNEQPFAIPRHFLEEKLYVEQEATLREQLAPIPIQYDAEGRLFLPPKNSTSADSTTVTLRELVGCSPDEADSLVLGVFGLHVKISRGYVTAL